jgi:hypothetical protein
MQRGCCAARRDCGRGRALVEVEVRADRAEPRRYSHANLEDYWRPPTDALARFAAEGARPDVLAWFVLGVDQALTHRAIGELAIAP